VNGCSVSSRVHRLKDPGGCIDPTGHFANHAINAIGVILFTNEAEVQEPSVGVDVDLKQVVGEPGDSGREDGSLFHELSILGISMRGSFGSRFHNRLPSNLGGGFPEGAIEPDEDLRHPSALD